MSTKRKDSFVRSEGSDSCKKALFYAKRGFAVIPVHGIQNGKCTCARGHACQNPGKHPATSHGAKDATRNREKIRSWFKNGSWLNVGIVTGQKSDLVVLDIDPRNGGDETLDKLERQNGSLPKTVTVRTGGGGRHLYFRYPESRIANDTSGGHLGPGIDISSDGRFVVAPPSRHASGSSYRFLKGEGLKSRQVEPMPGRLLEKLRKQAARKLPVAAAEGPDMATEPLSEGTRNSALTTLAGKLHRIRLPNSAIIAALNHENTRRCIPPLSVSEIGAIVDSVTSYSNDIAYEDTAVWIMRETLRRDFNEGAHLMFAADGQFWRFRKTHWSPCSRSWIKNRAFLTMKSAGSINGQSSPLLQQVVNLLEAETAQVEDLLAFTREPPDVINCRNGELWIAKNGDVELRPHDPKSYLRSYIDVDFDPSARCSLYDRTMKEIFAGSENTEDMRRHWNEIVGYTLSPCRKIASIVVLYGTGGNGKTTLVELLTRLLGSEQVMSSRVEELDANRFKIGELLGKRLFVDDDVRAGARLPDGALKKISEEKTLTGERKFGPSFQFVVRVLPMLLCNNALSLADVSAGMTRRLMVIPFRRRFSNKKMDRNRLDKIVESELSGVLNRAVAGLQRVIRRGQVFRLPRDVKEATQQWLRMSNPIPAFVDECCETRADFNSYCQDLYDAYRQWSTVNGMTLLQQRGSFMRNLEHCGFQPGNRGNRGRRMRGLKLRAEVKRQHADAANDAHRPAM